MNTCDTAILSAYLDGELNDDARGRVEAHLMQCESCASELRELEALASSIADYPFADLDTYELKRLHESIKADERESIWRFGGVLAAMAASVAIVSGVWLTQLPKHQTQTARSATPPQNWERIAVNLRVDPFQVNDEPTQYLAENDLPALMLEGLKGSER